MLIWVKQWVHSNGNDSGMIMGYFLGFYDDYNNRDLIIQHGDHEIIP